MNKNYFNIVYKLFFIHLDKVDFLHCIFKQSNLNAYRISVVNKRREKKNTLCKEEFKDTFIVCDASEEPAGGVGEP